MERGPHDPGLEALVRHGRALREEVDRLRLENQRLHAELEEVRDLRRSAGWHARRLWRDGWYRLYVLRW
jgi:hypothetical protein